MQAWKWYWQHVEKRCADDAGLGSADWVYECALDPYNPLLICADRQAFWRMK